MGPKPPNQHRVCARDNCDRTEDAGNMGRISKIPGTDEWQCARCYDRYDRPRTVISQHRVCARDDCDRTEDDGNMGRISKIPGTDEWECKRCYDRFYRIRTVTRTVISQHRVCARDDCDRTEDDGNMGRRIYKIPGTDEWQCNRCYDRFYKTTVISRHRVCARDDCDRTEDAGNMGQIHKIPGTDEWQCDRCYVKTRTVISQHRVCARDDCDRTEDAGNMGHPYKIPGTDEWQCDRCYVKTRTVISQHRVCARDDCDRTEDAGNMGHPYKIPGTDEWQCERCYRFSRTTDPLALMIQEVASRTTEGHWLNSSCQQPGLDKTDWQSAPPYTKKHIHHGTALPVYDVTSALEHNSTRLFNSLQQLKRQYLFDDSALDDDDNDDDIEQSSLMDHSNLIAELRPKPAGGHSDRKSPPTNEAGYASWPAGIPSTAANSRDEMEDICTQLTQLSYERFKNGQPAEIMPKVSYLDKQYRPVIGPSLQGKKRYRRISICRTSKRVPQHVVNALHITNMIVSNDLDTEYTAARMQNPEMPFMPTANDDYDSLVFNGRRAWHAFPVYHSPDDTYSEARFIDILDEASRESQEVLLVIRGIAGFSTWPNVYARIHLRWPDLIVRIVYAVRERFIHVEEEDRFDPLPIEFTPVSQRGLQYSRPINIRSRVDQHLHVESARSAHLETLDDDETSGRTRRVPANRSHRILQSRGASRNSILPGPGFHIPDDGAEGHLNNELQ